MLHRLLVLGVKYMSAYGAAKAGLINFSRASAVEGLLVE